MEGHGADHRDLHPHVDEVVVLVVGEVELGFAALGEEPVGLDDRPDHDGGKGPGRDLDRVPAHDLHHDRIAVLLEVPVVAVLHPRLQVQGPDEVHEGDVVQGKRGGHLAGVLLVRPAPAPLLGEDLVVAVALVARLPDALVEAPAHQVTDVEPGLEAVVHPGHGDAALQVHDEPVRRIAPDRVHPGHLEGPVADREDPHLHLVLHPLAGPEGDRGGRRIERRPFVRGGVVGRGPVVLTRRGRRDPGKGQDARQQRRRPEAPGRPHAAPSPFQAPPRMGSRSQRVRSGRKRVSRRRMP